MIARFQSWNRELTTIRFNRFQFDQGAQNILAAKATLAAPFVSLGSAVAAPFVAAGSKVVALIIKGKTIVGAKVLKLAALKGAAAGKIKAAAVALPAALVSDNRSELISILLRRHFVSGWKEGSDWK